MPPEPGDDPQAALRQHCLRQLARYKVPDLFVISESLPRNAMGKVRRDLLAEELRRLNPDEVYGETLTRFAAVAGR